MKKQNNLIRIYSGSEVLVNLLKGKLENTGMLTSIQNDSNDSFIVGVPIAIDLYIQEFDLKKATPIVNDFIKKNRA